VIRVVRHGKATHIRGRARRSWSDRAELIGVGRQRWSGIGARI
jgi:hypothetical protein